MSNITHTTLAHLQEAIDKANSQPVNTYSRLLGLTLQDDLLCTKIPTGAMVCFETKTHLYLDILGITGTQQVRAEFSGILAYPLEVETIALYIARKKPLLDMKDYTEQEMLIGKTELKPIMTNQQIRERIAESGKTKIKDVVSYFKNIVASKYRYNEKEVKAEAKDMFKTMSK